MEAIPRLLIAATASGSGKTTVTCGLLAALLQKNKRPVSCKCGPDYIDPMFHREVLGVDACNLDLFFCKKPLLQSLFADHAEGADIALIEGVMGFYDGMALDTDSGSSYEVACCLKTPVILVVPCKGMALSLVPVIKGMLAFRKDSNIRGILLNGVSQGLYPRLKALVEKELAQSGYPVQVVGYVPQLTSRALKSRHLGLVMPGEIENIREQMEKLGSLFLQTIEWETLLKIAASAPPVETEPLHHFLPQKTGKEESVKIAVAKDAAFCFYYKENLELLERLGCVPVPFSPLEDQRLPEGISGLMLGGGYPELYAGRLAKNKELLSNIRDALSDGLPCIAECGGFLYLHEELEDREGTVHKMAGVIKGRAFWTGKLVRFGYIELHKEGQERVLRGHEFHYWDSTDNGRAYTAVKPGGAKKWECIHETETLFAGFPHLHFYSHPSFATDFVNVCKKRRTR